MNNKVILGVVIVLAIVLGLPLIAGLLMPPQAAAPPAAPAPVAAPPPPPTFQPPQPQPAQPVYEAPQQPAFQLNAQTLANTAWMVNTPQGQVEVQLLQGGQALASHPMVGQIEGTWRVAGSQVNVTAKVFNQSYNLSCNIQGDTLMYQGAPIQRLR